MGRLWLDRRSMQKFDACQVGARAREKIVYSSDARRHREIMRLAYRIATSIITLLTMAFVLWST